MVLPYRVLVVEDDRRLRSVLVRGLQNRGLDVTAAVDGAAALSLTSGPPPFEVIVLDIGLPDADGRDVCQALRSRGVDALVLFLTARGQVGDQLSAFAAGGDDYLAKPFDFDVLFARIVALARRAELRSEPAPESVSALHLDPHTHSLVSGGITVALTPTEFRILGCLMAVGERVLRRRELVAAAWPSGAMVSDNTLDQYLARIRRKLSGMGDPARVITVHGVGYQFVVGVSR